MATGTGLASAGSAVLNHFFDKDIDALMNRTKSRPLPSGSINPKSAFIFGLALLFSVMVFDMRRYNGNKVAFALYGFPRTWRLSCSCGSHSPNTCHIQARPSRLLLPLHNRPSQKKARLCIARSRKRGTYRWAFWKSETCR